MRAPDGEEGGVRDVKSDVDSAVAAFSGRELWVKEESEPFSSSRLRLDPFPVPVLVQEPILQDSWKCPLPLLPISLPG